MGNSSNEPPYFIAFIFADRLVPSAVFTEISSEGNAAKAVKNDQKSKNIKCFEGQSTKYYTERPKTRNKGPVKV